MYQVEEFPEVWADACIRESDGRFLFVSLYGRDGSLMQFMAAMQLGNKEGGIQRFHLRDADGQRHLVEVGGVDRLGKHTGRLPKQNLFGPLGQLWVFDRNLQEPDRANRIGWALHYSAVSDLACLNEAQENDLDDRAWQLIKSLSPVALLDHWRAEVLAWCRDKQAVQVMGSDLYPTLGPVKAVRVSLSEHFLDFISDGVRVGRLRLQL